MNRESIIASRSVGSRGIMINFLVFTACTPLNRDASLDVLCTICEAVYIYIYIYMVNRLKSKCWNPTVWVNESHEID